MNRSPNDRREAQSALAQALFSVPDGQTSAQSDWTQLPDERRRDVLALAVDHGVLPTLGAWLADGGLGPSVPRAALAHLASRGADIPAEMVALLALYRSEARVTALMAQLDVLDAAWSQAGISFLPLKGAHQQRSGWWPRIGVRGMSDLDVLFRPEDVARAVAVASDLGCVPVGPLGGPVEQSRGRFVPAAVLRLAARPLDRVPGHHARPLVLPGGVGLVEPHTAPVITGLSAFLSASHCWTAGTEASVLADHLAVRQIVLHDVVVDCLHRRRRKPFRAATDLVARVRAQHLGPVEFDRAFGPLYDGGLGPPVDIVLELIRRHGSGVAVPQARHRAKVDRWFRSSDVFEDRLAHSAVATYSQALDRFHLASNYGRVALERPWWTRAQHLLESAAARR